MKNKPISHKNQNTFKFLTFAERLNNIHIDVIRRVGKTSNKPEDANTFFQEALDKWQDLNYTEDYGILKKELDPNNIQNLLQLVSRKDEIIEVLLQTLRNPENMALDAALELVWALARDLQFEFHSDFPKFFDALTQLLKTKDTELVEKVFVCLSYLFKFLWRYMLRDMKDTYSLFSSLLNEDNEEHIRNFAAESFAFLIRKVKDKTEFFMYMFSLLKENPEKADGVGQLLFEVVKGVKEQLHSCAKEVLLLLMKCLGNESIEIDLQNLMETAMLRMLTSIGKHISKNNAHVIEDVFSEILLEFLNLTHEEVGLKISASNHMDSVLRLLLFWVDYKAGVFISPNTKITNVLVTFCQCKERSSSSVALGFKIMNSLLLLRHVDVSLKDLNCLLDYVYSNDSNCCAVFDFTRQMFAYGMFEKDILERLLSYCCHILKEANTSSAEVMEVLTETVNAFRPFSRSPEALKKFSKLPLFTPTGEHDDQMLENVYVEGLKFDGRNICLEDLPKLWCCLVGLPHFRSLNVKSMPNELLEKLSMALVQLLENSRSENNSENEEIILFVISEAFFCWQCLGGKADSSPHFSVSYFMDLLSKFPKSLSVLRMFENYLSSLKDLELLDLSEVNIVTIINTLLPNLASPFHLVRLHSLQVLSLFHLPLPVTDDKKSEEFSVFDICLKAEKVPVSVQEYRAKVKWLQKLEFPFVKKHIPTVFEEQCRQVPVYYLLGCLYINFTLLWKPIFEVLQSLADGMNNEFWTVFKPCLIEVMDFAEAANVKGVDPRLLFGIKNVMTFGENSSFTITYKSLCEPTDIPDVVNYRNLLWKAMGYFPTVVRPKSTDVVPLLFKFIENEIARVDSMLASSETLAKTEDTKGLAFNQSDIYDDELEDEENDDEEKEDEQEEEENDDGEGFKVSLKKKKLSDDAVQDSANIILADDLAPNSETIIGNNAGPNTHSNSKRKRKKDSSEGQGKRRRGILKTLGTILSLFTKFKKPSTLHQTDNLKRLYYELLSYQDETIQKLSFDCIMTYNFDYLVPYKEHFYKILDNKTFKTEIVLFNLDNEQEVIQGNHRMDALAVLMRILYGKMLHKTGNNTTGKAQAFTRKALVLRFLAGCRSDEIKMFFDLVFAAFLDYVKGDVLSVVKTIRQTTNPSSVVPVRKMRSALNTLEVILLNLGSLMPDLLPWFLKVLLAIATMSSTLLAQRQELLPQCLTILKLVRRQAIMRLIQFFKSFDHYQYSLEDIDAIFEAIVWPALPKLEFEALNQPPPLLRLFDVWSSNSRFFIFFAKHHDKNHDLSILPHLMSLYTSDHIRPRVTGLLSKMFLQLLTFPNFESVSSNDDMSSVISINDCIPLPDMPIQENKEPASFGVRLLYPHVGALLMRLRITVLKASKNTKRSLNNRDLSILLKISEYVDDPAKSSELIELLFSFFSKQHKLSADSEVLVLATVCNLMKHAENVKRFVKYVSPVFSFLAHQRSRQSLIKVLASIAGKDNSVQNLATVVEKMNAWNPDLVEEPDYQTRLDGQAEALSAISSMTDVIDEDFIRIIIFNCAFMIRTCDDLSLRDSASYLLQELAKKFPDFRQTSPEFFKLFVFDTLLVEVKQGIKCKTEPVRCEFIRILAIVLHSCGEHPRLLHLAQLCDKDPDMDFWQNILHLQVHRRARGLLRFAAKLKSGEITMHSFVLTTYMVPIVSAFFFDSAYKKHVHVIDAAIETFEAIIEKLPWSNYEAVLRYYLNLLSKDTEHHKIIVKIIVAILNAFHFDLSSSRGLKEEFQGPVRKFKKNKIMKKKKEEAEQILEPAADSDQLPVTDITDLTSQENVEEATPDDAGSKVSSEERATRIHNIVAKSILPQLQRSLMHKSKNDDEHKLAGHSFPEDEEVLRVPVALAMVKLLQNLPQESLRRNIPGLFLKMCQLLKSRSESIRETARDTLVKMMQSLGPNYFWYLLHEMKGVMKKGYQVHVMTFTVNSIMLSLKDQFKPGDLDTSISNITEICLNELFGETAEEKEVTKITGKLKEARSSKSYSLYEILSQFISEGCLLELVEPLKKTLMSTRSHKAIRKCHECLRHVALGLAENTGLSIKGQLIFVQHIMAENLIFMCPKSNKKAAPTNKTPNRPDTFLIPKEPGRGIQPASTSAKTNAHVLVEFCLHVFHFCLKRGKLTDAPEHLALLDPLIPVLSECIGSNYIKIITMGLRCMTWLLKFPLPSLNDNASTLVNSLFVLINKYAGVGMGQGENFEMVVMCFKMLTVVVRDTDYYTLSEDQLRVLLSYIEQDIHDHTRQATAFSLLKAILAKKLQVPELPAVMKKIAEMAIISEQENIRTQSRQASLQYILEYPLGKKLQSVFSFYVNQLDYFHEHGRISAMEVIKSIINYSPLNVIKRNSGLFLIPLAARLVNDEASRCRKMAAEIIKNMLGKLQHDERTNLFSVAFTWFENSKLSHRRLGAQLCGIFAEVEKQKFERFLPDVLPIIEKQLEEGKTIEEQNHTNERCTDHFLYHLLNAFTKIIINCSVINNQKFNSTLCSIWGHLQDLILHPHSWIRLLVSQLFGLLFAAHPVEQVLEAINDDQTGNTAIYLNSRQKLRDLSADFVTQLQSPLLNEALGEQVIKNLVYLAKIIGKISDTGLSEVEKPSGGNVENTRDDKDVEVTMAWMLKKLCREAKKEVAQVPQSSIKRKCIFKFLATVSLELESNVLETFAADIFSPLCRELSDASINTDQSLKSLAQEVLNVLKNVLGIETFNKIYAIIQSVLVKKKIKRKQDRVKEAVTNPEKFARKKIKKQQNKKEAKKRKILVQKGKKKSKKAKLSDLAFES